MTWTADNHLQSVTHAKSLDSGTKSINTLTLQSPCRILCYLRLSTNIQSTAKNKIGSDNISKKNRYWGGRFDTIRYVNIRRYYYLYLDGVVNLYPLTSNLTALKQSCPFSVTRPNPTHHLTDPTQPNPMQIQKFGPNPTQPIIDNKLTLRPSKETIHTVRLHITAHRASTW